MSRRSWGNSLLDILRELGVHIDRDTEVAIMHEKETTEASTVDIVTRMLIAPPDVVEKAVEIARESGSVEVLEACFSNAKQSMREARKASLRLTEVAQSIATKK